MRYRDRLPGSSRSWTCPYFRVIIIALLIGVIAGALSGIHYTLQVILMLIVAFLIGITIGSRRIGESCET